MKYIQSSTSKGGKYRFKMATTIKGMNAILKLYVSILIETQWNCTV